MASLTRPQLKTSSNSTYDTNGVGGITATEVRTFNDDLIDSLITNDLTGAMSVASASNALTASSVSNGVLASLNSFTASATIRLNNLETTSASVNVSISNLNAATSSYAISASVAAVDAAQQQQINSLIAASSSYANSASFAASQLVQDGRLNNIESTTASLNISVTNLNASSASQEVSINALNTFTASQSTASIVTSITNLNTFSASALVSISNINSTTASLNTSVTNLNSTTASLNTSASLALVTASFDTGTRNLTFTKGNNTTFAVNIPDVSGSAGDFVTTSSFNSYTSSNDSKVNSLIAATGSYATTGSNSFNGNQIITGSMTSSLDIRVAGVPMGFGKNTGTSSIAIGVSTLLSNTGNSNIAIGTRALQGNTSGGNNTAIGLDALQTNTTGQRNIGIGEAAGRDNQTGQQNTFIGNNAGYNAGNVNSNTLIGYLAAQAVKSSYNTVVGETAALYITSGSGNTIIGQAAGVNVGSGSNNLFIGQNAGRLISGSNNVVLGHAQGVGSWNNVIALSDGSQNIRAIYNSGWVLTGSVDIQNTLTASLQQGFTYVGNASGRTVAVSTSSFASTINTGSFATTGSNTFVGNQTINADLTISQSKSIILGDDASIYTNKPGDGRNILTINSNKGLNISNATTGAFEISQAGPSKISISHTGGGSVELSGSSTVIQDVSFIPFSASLNTRILAVTIDTGSFATTSSFNSYTASTNTRLTNIESTTASLLIETQNLELFSASALISISNLNTATASLFTSTSLSLTTASFSGNTLTFTKGNGTTFGVVIPDVSGSGVPTGTISGSAQITALGFVSSSVTASSIITASVTNDDITFTKGDGSQFTIQVATGSFAISSSYADSASYAQFATDIYLNVKNTTGAQLNKGTVVRIIGATGDNALVATASWEDDNNSANTLGFLYENIANDSFGKVITQGTLLGIDTDPVLGYTAGQLIYLSSSGQYTNVIPPAPYHEVRLGQVLRAQQNNGSIYVLIQNGYELSELHDVDINTGSLANNDLLTWDSASLQWTNKTVSGVGATTTASFNSYTSSTNTRLTNIESATASLFTSASLALVTASFSGNTLTFIKGDASTFGVVIPDISGSSINTGSFATTGSNTFTADQTLIDAGGNTITLSDTSGSLMLVAKGFTSASAHLSSSAANKVNIIFKNNDIATSTYISGSNNIFTNSQAATAGFRKQLGSANINIFNILPEVSASMGYYVAIDNNFITSKTANPMSIRGPISSSQWEVRGNTLLSSVSIGTSATNNAEKIVSGLSFNQNHVGATVSFIANRNTLTQAPSVNNNSFLGAITLNMASSSIDYSNNINIGNSVVVRSESSGSASTNLNNTIYVNSNLIGGNTTIVGSGSNDPNDAQGIDFNGSVLRSLIYGSGINVKVNTGLTGSNTLAGTAIIGNSLTVSGSSRSPLTNSGTNLGSAFFGRYNALDGNKALSSQTVFAIGTGTGTSAASRKTGFLIDSGSNTFVEGTFNVSGSTSLNGNLVITGSLTASLQQGFVYVGNASGITTTVSTSSLGGGTIDTGSFATTGSNTFRGDQTITGSVSITGSLTTAGNMFQVTGSFNTFGNVITQLGVFTSSLAGGLEIDGIGYVGSGSAGAFFINSTTQDIKIQNYYSSSVNGKNIVIENFSQTGSAGIHGKVVLRARGTGGAVTVENSSQFRVECQTEITGSLIVSGSLSAANNIKMGRGTDKPTDKVTVGSGGLIVSNSLVTSNSYIFATNDTTVGNYSPVVSNITAGSFSLSNGGYGGNISVMYMIVNPY